MFSALLRLRLYSVLCESLVCEEDVWKNLDGSITVSTSWRVGVFPRLPRALLPVWRAYHGEVTSIRRATPGMVRQILARRLEIAGTTERAEYVQSPLL